MSRDTFSTTLFFRKSGFFENVSLCLGLSKTPLSKILISATAIIIFRTRHVFLIIWSRFLKICSGFLKARIMSFFWIIENLVPVFENLGQCLTDFRKSCPYFRKPDTYFQKSGPGFRKPGPKSLFSKIQSRFSIRGYPIFENILRLTEYL